MEVEKEHHSLVIYCGYDRFCDGGHGLDSVEL